MIADLLPIADDGRLHVRSENAILVPIGVPYLLEKGFHEEGHDNGRVAIDFREVPVRIEFPP